MIIASPISSISANLTENAKEDYLSSSMQKHIALSLYGRSGIMPGYSAAISNSKLQISTSKEIDTSILDRSGKKLSLDGKIGSYIYSYPFSYSYSNSTYSALNPFANIDLKTDFGRLSLTNSIERMGNDLHVGAGASTELRKSFRDISYLSMGSDKDEGLVAIQNIYSSQLIWFPGLWSHQYNYGLYRVNLPTIFIDKLIATEHSETHIAASWIPTTRYSGSLIPGMYQNTDSALLNAVRKLQSDTYYRNIIGVGVSYTHHFDDLGIRFVANGEIGDPKANVEIDTRERSKLLSYNVGVSGFYRGLMLSCSIGSMKNNIFASITNDDLYSNDASYWSVGGSYSIFNFGIDIGYLSSNNKLFKSSDSEWQEELYQPKNSGFTAQISYKAAKNLRAFCAGYYLRRESFFSSKGSRFVILLGLDYSIQYER